MPHAECTNRVYLYLPTVHRVYTVLYLLGGCCAELGRLGIRSIGERSISHYPRDLLLLMSILFLWDV